MDKGECLGELWKCKHCLVIRYNKLSNGQRGYVTTRFKLDDLQHEVASIQIGILGDQVRRFGPVHPKGSDLQQAIDLLRRSATQGGNISSLFKLSSCYHLGLGVARDAVDGERFGRLAQQWSSMKRRCVVAAAALKRKRKDTTSTTPVTALEHAKRRKLKEMAIAFL